MKKVGLQWISKLWKRALKIIHIHPSFGLAGVFLCGVLAWRLQLESGNHQHLKFLRLLPRNARKRFQRIQIDHSLFQHNRRARHLPGLSCASGMGAQSDAKNPGYQRFISLGSEINRYKRKIRSKTPQPRPASLGNDEVQQFSGMPKLP